MSGHGPGGTAPARLFFALWPDAATREALAEVQAGVGVRRARPVPAGNLHLTLLFLGRIDDRARAAVEAGAGAAAAGAFTLTLDTVGWFERPRVVWLAPSHVPEALLGLAARLRRAALDAGIEVERRAFKPHLTLLRRGRRPPSREPARVVQWRPSEFALVASETLPEGARYEVLRRWPIEPPAR